MKNKLSEKQLCPKGAKKNVPFQHLGHIGSRKNLKLEEIVMFAQEFFDRWKKGLSLSTFKGDLE